MKLSVLFFLFISLTIPCVTSFKTLVHAVDITLEDKADKPASKVRKVKEITDMIYIPAGYFTIGSNSNNEDEKPMHEVYLNAFYIDKYEVKNSDYDAFLAQKNQMRKVSFKDPVFTDHEHPVVAVTWDDANNYCRWSNKALPTEAQWEKAARGTDKRRWSWGDEWKESYKYNNLNLYGDYDHYEYTAPYNYYQAGVSFYGAYNMAGNVWEWCSDWYNDSYYSWGINVNPKGPQTGKMKVLRGGSWVNDILDISVTKRIRNYPNVSLDIYGFRCAVNIEK